MDRRMDHHRSSDSHDGLDRTFGNSVVMMSADSRVSNRLAELLKVLGEGLGREGGSIVEEVLLWNHSDISSCKLEQFLGLERFMGRQIGLELDVDVAGGVINEDTAARVHLAFFCLALATEQSAFGRADEVIHGDALPREELILSKCVHAILDGRAKGARGCALPLLAELAGHTHRWTWNSSARRMEPSGAFRGRKRPGTKQELYTLEREVSQAEMPAQQLLLGL
jgi:hypothetical protein